MTIRAVVFDIVGILEVIPEGGDPTRRFPQMIARWEERLHLAPGELDRRITQMDERLSAADDAIPGPSRSPFLHENNGRKSSWEILATSRRRALASSRGRM
jgi:hypothetical protein